MRGSGARVEEQELAAWCAAAARSGTPAAGAGHAIPAAVSERADEVEALVRLLRANRLGPAIDLALSRAVVAATSSRLDEFTEAMRAEAREAADLGLAGLAALRELADALDARAIPWLLWKGPALSVQVWGEPTRRRFSDLDIVVAPAAREAALSALEGAGWRVRDALPARTARVIHGSTCAYPLDKAGAPLVELHWAFAGRLYPAVARVEDVLARAERVTVAGREVRTPGGADALLLLSMHATKHGWSQAEEVVSFARLVAREPTALVAARAAAAAAGIPRVIALAERLVARLVERRDEPRGPVHGEPHVIDAMADACIARMLAGDGAWRRTNAWSLSWMSRRSDRARFRTGALWRPTPQEWLWLPLPSALVGAYPIVRMARLALRAVKLTR